MNIEMWKDASKMSREEMEEELEALREVRKLSARANIEGLLNQDMDLEPLEKANLTMTANGALYHRVKGFLPELMEKMYAERKAFKKKMLSCKQKLVDIEAEMKRRGLE